MFGEGNLLFPLGGPILPSSLSVWPGAGVFIANTIFVAIFCTLLRWTLTNTIFVKIAKKLLSNANSERLKKRENFAEKFSESCFKLLYYSFSWTYCVSIAIINGYIWDAKYCWYDPDIGQVVPELLINSSEFFIYYVEIGWYLHCSYAHLYEDSRKSDFYLLIIHHIATLLLMYGSMVYGYHRIGVLVLISMNFCDVALESAKIGVYVYESTKWNPPDYFQWCLYAPLPVSWLFFRIYYYLTVVLRSSYFHSQNVWREFRDPNGKLPYHQFFNSLLFILLLLNLWWFVLIVRTAINKTSKKQFSDIREDCK